MRNWLRQTIQRILFSAIIVIGFATATAEPRLDLSITPAHAFEGAPFRFTVKLDRAPVWLCTGWKYPVIQLYPEDWPMRRSCREVTARTIVEQWGADWRLPYTGDYIGFAELYVSSEAVRPTVTVTRAFQVLEDAQP